MPHAVLERMRLAQEQGTAAARAEGVAIAAEMVEAVKDLVQGVQVTAPAGRVDAALEVLLKSGVGSRESGVVGNRGRGSSARNFGPRTPVSSLQLSHSSSIIRRY